MWSLTMSELKNSRQSLRLSVSPSHNSRKVLAQRMVRHPQQRMLREKNSGGRN